VSRLFNAGDLEQLFIFDEKNPLEYVVSGGLAAW
jgi:hypothetical protein